MSKLETIKGDWSEHEHSRLDRIRAECAGYDGLEVECSHTDERDPWCIVYDRERDQVIVPLYGDESEPQTTPNRNVDLGSSGRCDGRAVPCRK